jgi:hypothetical protein
MDSYPEGLGQDLVVFIPTGERFESQSSSLPLSLSLSPPALPEWLASQRDRCQKMASSEYDHDYEKSTSPPENDLYIEWTYTYDLDNLHFVVDSKARFSLRAIARKSPEEWIPFIATDARGYRCLSLDTPSELVGQFTHIDDIFLGADPIPALSDFVPTSTISPSAWAKPLTPHHRRLLLAQVNATIAETYTELSMFPPCDRSVLQIQNLALSFLEAIVPNNQALVKGDSPRLDIPDHPKPPPGTSWFWYRRCLILLATQLDNRERFQLYVQAIAARAKAKNWVSCTALVWSVRHVAVVQVSQDGVSHSDPVPLLAAYGSDEEAFMSALHLLWYYLPYPRWRIVDETPTTSGSPNPAYLPTEILIKIMMFTAQDHYPKYQFLSRGFFKLWWDQLRVTYYTILPDAEQVPETSRSFNAYLPDENTSTGLRLELLWGKQTGEDMWRSDKPSRRRGLNPETVWSSLRRRLDHDFRLKRFCAYWPEFSPLSNEWSLPVVDNYFSGQSDVLCCLVGLDSLD